MYCIKMITLKDIKPKNLVLGQVINDFADATTKVNYDVEDLCCYVINNIECYYWINIESIWGPLGFVWDIINDYGHFNFNNIIFNKIPVIPDGHRIKQFNNTFNNIKNDIEVYKSNWENVIRFYSESNADHNDFNYNFIINGDYSIPDVYIENNDFDTLYQNKGFELKFPLNNTTLEIINVNLSIKQDDVKYFPIHNLNGDELYINFKENIITPIDILGNNKNKTLNICFKTDELNITEIHLYINYIKRTEDNYDQYSIIIYPRAYYEMEKYNYNNIVLHFHPNTSINNEDDSEIFYMSHVFNISNNLKFKDIIFEDLDNIKDKSLSSDMPDMCIDKTEWFPVDNRIYDKIVNGIKVYRIYFTAKDNIPINEYEFNLTRNETYMYINNNNKDIKKYITINNPYSVSIINVIDKQFLSNVTIENNTLNKISCTLSGNVKVYFLLDIELDKVITDERFACYIFTDKVKHIYTSDYNGFLILDIRIKKQYVINGDCSNIQLLVGEFVDNENVYFSTDAVEEVYPFNIDELNEENIKNFIIDYNYIYSINNVTKINYNITQPLVMSNINKILTETQYKVINNVEIIYIYKTPITVNKDSVLTNTKFMEIINAYIFDGNVESAKGITLQIYTTYFNLIPEDKINQFINDGYVINEIIN